MYSIAKYHSQLMAGNITHNAWQYHPCTKPFAVSLKLITVFIYNLFVQGREMVSLNIGFEMSMQLSFNGMNSSNIKSKHECRV
jgi:uncharacterized membrane protein YiaA